MGAKTKKLGCNERGSILLEAVLSLTTLLFMVFGIVEFSYLFYQWNAATKAAQLGARVAAVYSPVDASLTSINDTSASAYAGSSYTAGFGFKITCTGVNSTTKPSCVCTYPTNTTFGCPAKADPQLAPMNRIVTEMQRAFPRVQPQNVTVTYTYADYTKLGYVGRPGGPVPTITVGINGLTFNFVLLSALLPKSINIPAFSTTATGEDMKNGT